MKRAAFALAASLAVVLLIGIAPALSQDGMKKSGDESRMKSKEYLKAGPHHGWLAEMAGNWQITGNMWKSADADPQALSGESEFEMMFDRYLHEEFSVSGGEISMKGAGACTYNNITKQYETVLLGNMTPGLDVMPGTRNGNVLTFTSEKTIPGMSKINSRLVITKKDSNEATVQIFETHGEQPEFKTIELKYIRAK